MKLSKTPFRSPLPASLRLSALCLTLLLTLGWTRASANPPGHRKIVMTGDLTSSRKQIDSLSVPTAITADGIVTFAASAGFEGGMYAGKGGTLRTIVATGMRLPGGGTFGNFNTFGFGDTFTFNAVGDVAFYSSAVLPFGGRDPASLYLARGGMIYKLASEGDNAPRGGKFSNLERSPNLSDNGTVVFFAETNATGAPGQGIYLAKVSGGVPSIKLVVGVNDPSPNGGSFTGFLPAFDPLWTVNNSGRVLFSADTSVGGRVFSSDGSSITSIYSDGIDSGMISNGGAILVGGTFGGNIVFGTVSGIDYVAGTGGPAPGGRTYNTVGNAVSNNVGQVAFTATFAFDSEQGIYLWKSNEIQTIAKEGPAPGGGTINFGFGRPNFTLSNGGYVAFIAGTGTGNRIFLWNGSKLVPIISEGDALDGDQISELRFGFSESSVAAQGPVNERGQLAYWVRFKNSGKTGIFVYSPPPLAPVVSLIADRSGIQGQPFHLRVSASHTPTKFSATGLPRGMSIDPATGVFSGAPLVAGVFAVNVNASNAGGSGHDSFILTVVSLSPYADGYAGLIGDGTATNSTTGGLSLTLSRVGTFSGTIQIGGRSFTLHGAFDKNGMFTRSLPNSAFRVTLGLDLSNRTNVISGTVTKSGAPFATVSADRTQSGFTARHPIPEAGKYTVALPPDPAHPEVTYPHGNGYAIVIVRATGNVRVAGVLGDTTPFSMSAHLSSHHDFPLYVPLYARKGFVSGLVKINDGTTANDVAGTLNWLKPDTRGAFYPASFSGQTAVAGSSYVPQVLAYPNGGTFTITGGNVTVNSAAKDITIDTKNRIALVVAERFNMSISTKSGLFSGKFFDTNGKVRPFGGVILEKQNIGLGLFKGVSEVGAVDLTARP